MSGLHWRSRRDTKDTHKQTNHDTPPQKPTHIYICKQTTHDNPPISTPQLVSGRECDDAAHGPYGRQEGGGDDKGHNGGGAYAYACACVNVCIYVCLGVCIRRVCICAYKWDAPFDPIITTYPTTHLPPTAGAENAKKPPRHDTHQQLRLAKLPRYLCFRLLRFDNSLKKVCIFIEREMYVCIHVYIYMYVNIRAYLPAC